MGKVIAIHSFRGGTGKSNIAANLATCLATGGSKVAVMDLDLQSPGIHFIFGLSPGVTGRVLNDYLLEGCPIDEVVYDVGTRLGLGAGRLLLLPSSMQLAEISKVLNQGYSVALISSGIKRLMQTLALDYLFIDTHPGLNEETLFSFTIADQVLIVFRPDTQDYEGTSLTLEATRRLRAPAALIVNNIPACLNPDEVKAVSEQAYGAPVLAAIPHCDDVMALASESVFFLQEPESCFSHHIAAIASAVAGALTRAAAAVPVVALAPAGVLTGAPSNGAKAAP